MIIDLTPSPAGLLFGGLVILMFGAAGLICLVDFISHKLDKGK